MTDDLAPQTIQETDDVVERIFSEWDKWIDDPEDSRKVALRDQQNQLRELYDAYRSLGDSHTDADTMRRAELHEQITVLDKKMRKAKNQLSKELWQK